MFTLYKMTFYIKFLSLTAKVKRNKNKIDNKKIIIKLLTELKSYLKMLFTSLGRSALGKTVPSVLVLRAYSFYVFGAEKCQEIMITPFNLPLSSSLALFVRIESPYKCNV